MGCIIGEGLRQKRERREKQFEGRNRSVEGNLKSQLGCRVKISTLTLRAEGRSPHLAALRVTSQEGHGKKLTPFCLLFCFVLFSK